MDIMSDCVLVSIDKSNGTDHTVLVVGRKRSNGSIEIVNAFQGQEAIDMYNKLITKPGGPNYA